MSTLDLRDFWLGDVKAAGKPNPARVKHLVDLLKSRHIHTVPAVVVRVGKRGTLTADGDYAADRVAALREAFAGTLERLDRLEQLGRVRVLDETDQRRALDADLPAGQDPQTWAAAGEVIRGVLADLDAARAAKREEEGR